jgi:hypothetical protein
MATTKTVDPLFAAYKRTSRVEDIKFWLRTQGKHMLPQTWADFHELLEAAQKDLDKNRNPTAATLQRYIVLTQRHWAERPLSERILSHNPDIRRYYDRIEELKTSTATAVEKALNSKNPSIDIHGWTLTIAKVNPAETRFAQWVVTATKGEEVCELDENHEKTEAINRAVRFLQHRLADYFREIAGEGPVVLAEPEPDQLDAWDADGGAVIPSTVYAASQPNPIPEPEPIVAPAKPGRVLTYRYSWTDKGQAVDDTIEAASEKEARARIREKHQLKWVPNGATVRVA